MRDSRIRELSKEEVDELTGGGILRVIPVVKLFDMLRGQSRPTQFRRSPFKAVRDVCAHIFAYTPKDDRPDPRDERPADPRG